MINPIVQQVGYIQDEQAATKIHVDLHCIVRLEFFVKKPERQNEGWWKWRPTWEKH